MTRSRAGAESAPTELAAAYYEQRATAGLIITEGTAPSPNGQGYVEARHRLRSSPARIWWRG